MKRDLLSSLLVTAMLLTLASCALQEMAPASSPTPMETPISTAESATIPEENTPAEDKPHQAGKVLVAYFSATGNTRPLAEYAADSLDADLYEIIPETPYTTADLDWHDSSSRTTLEMNDDAARPAISGCVENMENYDVIFLGYPIWWGEAPRIICAFLEGYDFNGKTIVPFCTSGSSGIGSSADHLHPLTNGAEWVEGHRFSAGATEADVQSWLDSLELTK